MFVVKGPRGVKDCIERRSDGSGSDSDEPITKEVLLKVIFIIVSQLNEFYVM